MTLAARCRTPQTGDRGSPNSSGFWPRTQRFFEKRERDSLRLMQESEGISLNHRQPQSEIPVPAIPPGPRPRHVRLEAKQPGEEFLAGFSSWGRFLEHEAEPDRNSLPEPERVPGPVDGFGRGFLRDGVWRIGLSEASQQNLRRKTSYLEARQYFCHLGGNREGFAQRPAGVSLAASARSQGLCRAGPRHGQRRAGAAQAAVGSWG